MRHKCFPPAFIPDKNGKPMHSWRVLMLPYLEETSVCTSSIGSTSRGTVRTIGLGHADAPVYACPTTRRPDSTETSYAMLVGPHAFSDGPTGRTFERHQRRLSNTIMVVEAADAGINWMEPRDIDAEDSAVPNQFRPSSRRSATASEISSHHPSGANVAFCDGSVRFLSDTMDPELSRR